MIGKITLDGTAQRMNRAGKNTWYFADRAVNRMLADLNCMEPERWVLCTLDGTPTDRVSFTGGYVYIKDTTGGEDGEIIEGTWAVEIFLLTPNAITRDSDVDSIAIPYFYAEWDKSAHITSARGETYTTVDGEPVPAF